MNLQKHPLKLNQFNRQSPAQWLNNLAQIKQKSVFGAGSHIVKNMNQMPIGPRGMAGGMPGPCEMGGPGAGPRPMGPNMPGPMPDLEGMAEPNEMSGPPRDMMDHRHGDFAGGGVNPMNQMNMWNQVRSVLFYFCHRLTRFANKIIFL